MIKWLPAKFVLDTKAELSFQKSLNERSRLNTIVMGFLIIAVLLAFSLSSLLTANASSLAVNVVRSITIILAIIMILSIKQSTAAYLDTVLLFFGSLFTLINGFFFYTYAISHQELHEGGPMLSAIFITAIPMLHLGQKFMIWLILGIALIIIQLTTNVDIIWSINFYIMTVMVMTAMQYQTDVLLRKQYKYELIQTQKAETDKLTGVHNRYVFDKEFSAILCNLKKGQFLSLAMIDIDHFKKYNDRYGHLMGDKALVNFAELLSNQGADMVVRFGGEEFILVSVYSAENTSWLQDLPSQIEKLHIVHMDSETGFLSASAGVVTISAEQRHFVDKTKLLTLADSYLYQAKNAGRNQVLRQEVST
ncbi:GGDEF domain-containing protein [Shewanella donghaensis]|uniref:GGDEF domain-containing protein n=1 Tax=Shewanella donghaensis TaxID=238836 RepID=UPI001183ADAE|nr:GGDEF domain-containing protein [Shewanella donghaensis]